METTKISPQVLEAAQEGDLFSILMLLKDTDLEDLTATAAKICTEKFGNTVKLLALLEISNRCRQNCLYCGNRRDNCSLKRSRVYEEQIIDVVEATKKTGFKTVCLQSGEDAYFGFRTLEKLVRRIKNRQMRLILSCGAFPLVGFRTLKAAGTDGYLMRIETGNPDLYAKMHPGQKFRKRQEAVINLKKTGFYLATGSLVGLPGQTYEDIAGDIAFFRQIKADFIGIGPLIPHPDTPLASVQKPSLETALRTIAVCRIVCPDADIPATTAMEALTRNGLKKAFLAGANMVMRSVTLKSLQYEIFPGKSATGTAEGNWLQKLTEDLQKIGRIPEFW